MTADPITGAIAYLLKLEANAGQYETPLAVSFETRDQHYIRSEERLQGLLTAALNDLQKRVRLLKGNTI